MKIRPDEIPTLLRVLPTVVLSVAGGALLGFGWVWTHTHDTLADFGGES